MDARIFELDGLPSLVLFRDCDDNGQTVVKLRAVQIMNDDLDNFMEEDIVFGKTLSARNFIKNYDEDQAKDWLYNNIQNED